MDCAQGGESEVLFMKGDITPFVCVCVRQILLRPIEGEKVITQAKSSPLGKMCGTYREQVRLNKPVLLRSLSVFVTHGNLMHCIFLLPCHHTQSDTDRQINVSLERSFRPNNAVFFGANTNFRR